MTIKRALIFFLIAEALIQAVGCIQVSVSGGSEGDSGSATLDFGALDLTAIDSQFAINGADITPYTAAIGPVIKFEQTHTVKDASGKSASVYVKVLNAPNGLTYSSRVLPREGSVATQTQVSAEQWLSVPKAGSIKCTAFSSYGTARSASIGLEENKGISTGDCVMLTGYYGKALTTSTSVLASQTATSGTANSVKIYGASKDSSGTYSVTTSLNGISGKKATFSELSETSSAGASTQVMQKEHVNGAFTGTATYAPKTGTAKTKTRNSNYGVEYDINMKAAKDSSPTGILGYYVKPSTTACKIQGAVNAAQSMDTINVAAGTYKENVVIDKSLTVKGVSRTSTIVNGNKLGSVFKIGTVNSKIDVTLSDLSITGGTGTAIGNKKWGGGVYNKARTTIKNCLVFANSATHVGGVFNSGTATIIDSTISGNSAAIGGGVGSYYGTINLYKVTISNNRAGVGDLTVGESGGGIDNYHGIMNLQNVIISNNQAYLGGGICNSFGTINLQSVTISNNRALKGNQWYDGVGGGIANTQGGTVNLISGSIDHNTASITGGGIFNAQSTVKGNKNIVHDNTPNQIVSV